MSFLDSIKSLTKPYDDEDFLDEQDMNRPEPEPETRQAAAPRSTYASSYAESQPKRSSYLRDEKVVNLNASGGAAALKVVLVKPERFETAAEIADHLRDKHTVIMNLEQTHKDVSRRLIDFLSGVAYAQDGKIKKVANATYIITPYNVDIMGDLVDELENSGLYF